MSCLETTAHPNTLGSTVERMASAAGSAAKTVDRDSNGHGITNCRRLWRLTSASARVADPVRKRAFIMSVAPLPLWVLLTPT